MRIFRLHRKQRAASDYGGSLVYPGRWNTAGTPMLYAASTLSLACLEVTVHLTANQIPADYVHSSAALGYVPPIADYRGDIGDDLSTRRFGQWWATQRNELAIRVPSVVIPIEFNVLLNPTHTKFNELAWSVSEAFRFDQRLLRGSKI